MGAMEQMAKSLGTLKGRQKEYSEKVHKLHLIEGWWWDSNKFQPRPDQPTQPQSAAVPHHWKWSDLKGPVYEMADPALGVGLGQGGGKAERRVLVYRNPGLGGQYAVTNLLYYPVKDVMVGTEFVFGHRKNFRDGFSVPDYRIQFSFKYNFSFLVLGN